MNTLKTTMSKIAQIEQPVKTDLAKHEVELGSFDDFKKAQSAAQNMYGNAVGRALDMEKGFDSVLSDLKMAKQAADRAMGVSDKFEQGIKTLGIDLPPMYTASKQRLLDDSKRIDKAINTLNKIKSELRF